VQVHAVGADNLGAVCARAALWGGSPSGLPTPELLPVSHQLVAPCMWSCSLLDALTARRLLRGTHRQTDMRPSECKHSCWLVQLSAAIGLPLGVAPYCVCVCRRMRWCDHTACEACASLPACLLAVPLLSLLCRSPVKCSAGSEGCMSLAIWCGMVICPDTSWH
jgi:hypothetical protein